MFASSAWMAAAGLHAHDDAEASDLAQFQGSHKHVYDKVPGINGINRGPG